MPDVWVSYEKVEDKDGWVEGDSEHLMVGRVDSVVETDGEHTGSTIGCYEAFCEDIKVGWSMWISWKARRSMP